MKNTLLLIILLFSTRLMAYDLHIEETNKTIEQWVAFVESSELLELKHFIEEQNPLSKETIRLELENSGVAEGGLWFFPRAHENKLRITIYGPRDEDIPFIKKIAEQFGGIVVGDEGERY